MDRYQYPTGNLCESENIIVTTRGLTTTTPMNRHSYFDNTMVDVNEAYHALTEQHKLQLVLELNLFLP